MEPTQPRTLLLADDHGVVREGVAAYCRQLSGTKVVGQCSNGEDAARMILELNPTFAILDLNMPKMSGLDVVRSVRKLGSSTHLIILSINRDPAVIRELFRCGADGYVLKDGPARHIVDAINYIADGGKYTTPLLQVDVDHSAPDSSGPDNDDPLSQLSRREHQVFTFLVEGMRPKDIALALDLSPKTVDTYRASIMRKLDVDGIAGLVKFAIQRNLAG